MIFYISILLVLIIIGYNITHFSLFYLLNKEAYEEYNRAKNDIKNKKIPDDDVNFIIYNQSLRYVSVKKLFCFYVDYDGSHVVNEYEVTDPYLTYCYMKKKTSGLINRIEGNTVSMRYWYKP